MLSMKPHHFFFVPLFSFHFHIFLFILIFFSSVFMYLAHILFCVGLFVVAQLLLDNVSSAIAHQIMYMPYWRTSNQSFCYVIKFVHVFPISKKLVCCVFTMKCNRFLVKTSHFVTHTIANFNLDTPIAVCS